MGGARSSRLRGVTLAIRRNEYVAIMGPSGSGKSTLMNLLGCLDTPNAGEYWLNGQEVSQTVRRRAGARPQPGDRLRLPDLQPAAPRHRAAQRRAAAGLRRRARPTSGASARRQALERVRPRRPHGPPAERALRRPAPARRHRPRAGERPVDPPRRRADRQPRLATCEEIMRVFEELARRRARPSSW